MKVSQYVPAPPEEVFPYLHDPPLMKRWMAGFVRAEPSGTGPVEVGSRSTDYFEENGRTIRMETEVIEFDPPRLLAAAVDGPVGALTSSFRLRADGSGTHLSHTSSGVWRMPYRLLGPIMTAMARRRAAADLERLAGLFQPDG